MCIYSIVPKEIIYGQHQFIGEKTTTINYHGILLEGISQNNGKFTITRVISTNLDSYLNPNLMPGNIIELNRKEEYKH